MKIWRLPSACGITGLVSADNGLWHSLVVDACNTVLHKGKHATLEKAQRGAEALIQEFCVEREK